MHVSYAKTVYGQKEIDAVVQCLKESTQMGKYTRQFEASIAKLFDKRFGLFVNSGSSALFVSMESCNFPAGSEVITPALTFSTTVGSIVKAGLIPSFVDVGINDYVIKVDKIEEMITPKTVAILAPNLLGNLCGWDRIKEIANKYNLQIIEDSADTLGATLHGKSSGYWTDISITSFYGSHIINCAGNGGMACINSPEILEQAKLLRSWGRSSSLFDEKSESVENRFNVDVDGISYDAKFLFEKIGYNVEGSEVGAAFGLAQLQDLESNIKTRILNYQAQSELFGRYEEFFILPQQTPGARTGWLAYPILIRSDAPFTRKQMQIELEKNNIQTRVIFTGNITRQPGFKNIDMKVSKDGYVNADNVMAHGVLLACHHGLDDAMLSYMHDVIEKFVTKARSK
jgi:CDP-6-deoxy-D-xylo-4-hexulose-3-dehydrase